MKIGMRIDIDPSVCGIITNGDVIKALFPDAKITDHFELGTPIGNLIYIRLCKYQEMRVQYDWWDAPYKAKSENKE